MRIVAALVCAFLFSLALPSLSFAGSNCGDGGNAKNCVKNNSDQKGKGNCNQNGNCEKAKDKAKDKADDDHSVSCMEINSLALRRECLDRRRD